MSASSKSLPTFECTAHTHTKMIEENILSFNFISFSFILAHNLEELWKVFHTQICVYLPRNMYTWRDREKMTACDDSVRFVLWSHLNFSFWGFHFIFIHFDESYRLQRSNSKNACIYMLALANNNRIDWLKTTVTVYAFLLILSIKIGFIRKFKLGILCFARFFFLSFFYLICKRCRFFHSSTNFRLYSQKNLLAVFLFCF